MSPLVFKSYFAMLLAAAKAIAIFILSSETAGAAAAAAGWAGGKTLFKKPSTTNCKTFIIQTSIIRNAKVIPMPTTISSTLLAKTLPSIEYSPYNLKIHIAYIYHSQGFPLTQNKAAFRVNIFGRALHRFLKNVHFNRLAQV